MCMDKEMGTKNMVCMPGKGDQLNLLEYQRHKTETRVLYFCNYLSPEGYVFVSVGLPVHPSNFQPLYVKSSDPTSVTFSGKDRNRPMKN